MIKEAIDRILGLALIERFHIDGREYTSQALVPVKPESSDGLTIHTLTGISDYLISNPDDFDLNKIIVQVVSHLRVEAFSSLEPKWKDRDHCISAVITPKTFPFGSYLSTEEMIIALQTYFVDTPTSAALMKVVGNISDDTIVKALDDGVSQEVTVKSGIARLANVELPNPIILKPYRTFLEVDQPESRFVFRLRKKDGKEGGLPVCALFEADGGNWQLQAIERVRDWLRVYLPTEVTANIIA